MPEQQPTQPQGILPDMPPPKNPTKGFSIGGQKKPPAIDQNVTALITETNNQSRRLRLLEERYLMLRRKTQVTEQNMITHFKKASTEVKSALETVRTLKNEMRELSEKLGLLQEELKETAKKREVQLIHKYIMYWNPTEFLTKQEAKKLIEEAKSKQE